MCLTFSIALSLTSFLSLFFGCSHHATNARGNLCTCTTTKNLNKFISSLLLPSRVHPTLKSLSLVSLLFSLSHTTRRTRLRFRSTCATGLRRTRKFRGQRWHGWSTCCARDENSSTSFGKRMSKASACRRKTTTTEMASSAREDHHGNSIFSMDSMVESRSSVEQRSLEHRIPTYFHCSGATGGACCAPCFPVPLLLLRMTDLKRDPPHVLDKERFVYLTFVK